MFNALFPIVLLITSTLVGFVYIEPKYQDIVRAQSQEEQVNTTLSRARDITRITNDLSRSLSSISIADSNKMDVVLPHSVDSVRFVHMLTTVASRHGIVLSNVGVSNEEESTGPGLGFTKLTDEPQLESLDVRISSIATYDVFRAFLQDIENSLVFMDIDSLRLSLGSGDDTYSFDVSLHTYWMK